MHGKWQVKKLTLTAKSQNFLKEQVFLLTPVKSLPVPCAGIQLAISQFLPNSTALLHNSSEQRFVRVLSATT